MIFQKQLFVPMIIWPCHNALAERGYLVPRDIAVSGCDNMEITKDFIPSITTLGMPVFDMGMEAVDKIHLCNQGRPKEKTSYLKKITYIRESCGCKGRNYQENLILRRNNVLNEVEDKDQSISRNAYMSIDLTGVTQQEEICKKLAKYTYLNEGLSSFYMCLFKDWDKYLPGRDFNEVPRSTKVTMEIGMNNNEWLPKVQFDIKELTPPNYIDEELEDMSIKDELTGLYNRRALHTLGQAHLDQSIERNARIMVFSADMDNLKYINDNYGHATGDIAIKAVADALVYSSEDDEICIRMGGDEFSVIGVEYDDGKMKRFLDRFEQALKRFNKNNEKDFNIRISYGWSITQTNKDTNLEECLTIADARMYQQKHEKEVKGLRHKK